MAVRIIGIRKDNGNHYNPHEGITDYQWTNEQTRATGISSRTEMIRFFEVLKINSETWLGSEFKHLRGERNI